MKVLAAFFKYDYGDVSKGYSNEYLIWVVQLKKTGNEIDTFFLEENGYPGDQEGLQRSLIEYVELAKPDIVFFMFMRDEIHIDTLKTLSTMTKTVNWFCDDQWRFESYSRHLAPYLSLCLTVDKYCVEKYYRAGFENVRQVSWGPSHDMPAECLIPDAYEFDVTFVGQKNDTREWLITQLERSGIEVTCFGPGWKNGKVSLERMQEIFRLSKVNLNLSNSVPSDFLYAKYHYERRLRDYRRGILTIKPWRAVASLFKWLGLKVSGIQEVNGDKNREQIKARYFEIPACEGFQVGRMVLGLDDYFEIGKEIAVYTTVDELVETIRYYLNHGNERWEIIAKGFKRVAGFQYHKQLEAVFSSIESGGS